jgi:hypothetical protein
MFTSIAFLHDSVELAPQRVGVAQSLLDGSCFRIVECVVQVALQLLAGRCGHKEPDGSWRQVIQRLICWNVNA